MLKITVTWSKLQLGGLSGCSAESQWKEAQDKRQGSTQETDAAIGQEGVMAWTTAVMMGRGEKW